MDAGHISKKEDIKSWFCSRKHKVTTCKDFIFSSINAKNEFVKNKQTLLELLGKRS